MIFETYFEFFATSKDNSIRDLLLILIRFFFRIDFEPPRAGIKAKIFFCLYFSHLILGSIIFLSILTFEFNILLIFC